jgi:cytochrome b6-f complex iron-sulfur subunit
MKQGVSRMEIKEQDQSRRSFLQNLGIAGALIIAIGLYIRNSFSFLLPKHKEKTYHKYLVSKVGEIAPGQAKEITIAGKPVFVTNIDNNYKVFSGVCTHLGCIVRWEENKSRFYCPCHQGIFSKTGEVIGGPPPRPLDEFQVEVENKLVFIKVEDKKEGPWA